MCTMYKGIRRAHHTVRRLSVYIIRARFYRATSFPTVYCIIPASTVFACIHNLVVPTYSPRRGDDGAIKNLAMTVGFSLFLSFRFVYVCARTYTPSTRRVLLLFFSLPWQLLQQVHNKRPRHTHTRVNSTGPTPGWTRTAHAIYILCIMHRVPDTFIAIFRSGRAKVKPGGSLELLYTINVFPDCFVRWNNRIATEGN